MGRIIRNGIEYGSGNENATNINYDGSVSGLEATTVQAAVDEVQGNIDTLNDSLEMKVDSYYSKYVFKRVTIPDGKTSTSLTTVDFSDVLPANAGIVGASIKLGGYVLPYFEQGLAATYVYTIINKEIVIINKASAWDNYPVYFIIDYTLY